MSVPAEIFSPRIESHERQGQLSLVDNALYLESPTNKGWVVLTSVNFVPVLALQEKDLIMAFPVNLLSEEDQLLIEGYSIHKKMQSTLRRTSYKNE